MTEPGGLARHTARHAGWASAAAGAAAALAGAAPMLLAGTVIAVLRPDALLDGDQAVDELALMRAEHLAQLVGNYSRYGWNHPGPAWFYALEPTYASLGGHDWSFYVAVLLFHAVLAGLIVAAVWRQGGPFAALVTSVLVLLYVRTLGEVVFQTIWPPYALMLPMALLFILAAAGAAGSTPAMIGALIAGSFLVQTHVGTVPIALSLLAAMAALRVVTAGWQAGPRTRPTTDSASRRGRPLTALLTAGGAVLVVLMWVPVAIDEIRGRPGNLTELWWFFTAQHDRHPYHEAVSALGRMLEVYPFGQLPPFLESDFSTMPAHRWLALGVFLAGAALLAVLATAQRRRFTAALAVLLLVAVPVTTLSISRIVGPMYSYLLVWATTFPMLLAVGWTVLLVQARPLSRWHPARARPVAAAMGAGLVTAVLALATARFAAFEQLPPVSAHTYDPGSRAAWAMTEAALASDSPQPVLVYIGQNDRWTLASAVVLELAKHGWKVTTTDRFVFLYGSDSRSTGRERIELVILGQSDLQGDSWRQVPGLQPIGRTQDTYLFVRRGAQTPAG